MTAQDPIQPRLSAADAQALLEGRHGAPFALLGPHPVGSQWQVTGFFPGADRLWLQPQGGPEVEAHPLGSGLFYAQMPDLRPYLWRAQAQDRDWVSDDPYRFAPILGEVDDYLMGEGSHQRLWQVLGAHPITHQGVEGVHFALWAPNASRVSVVGGFNYWDGRRHVMRRRGASGVWEIFIPGLSEGTAYNYELLDSNGQLLPLKADPMGFGAMLAPQRASVVRHVGFAHDAPDWMESRAARNSISAPISIYEVHLGSWKRSDGGRMLSYRDLAHELVDYVISMGFTHIELLPISEHPFTGSWGYQPLGLYAPTCRHGTPADFAAFVEAAHQKGIGVLLDWVPGHFPADSHGLARFDGTALYEHADPREGFHQDWNTLIYNFGRREVENYLTANARYWLEEYHLDGLRVDAVASMLYRDYSREPGEWIPNKDGGRENYEAIALLQSMNIQAYGACPGIMTVAEESTAFPGVSRAVDQGGLGFGFKWNMGWMNDTLGYMQKDPIHRRHHHKQMTFGIFYAWSENFILPISHDEVVHGKGSMLGKMPGDLAEKFANLRAFYGFMWGHPGKKLLFMGQEFAQSREWNHDQSLDWHLLDEASHQGVQQLIRDLNKTYRDHAALHLYDTRAEGFTWIEANDDEASVFSWLRMGLADDPMVAVLVNMTPVAREYRIGLPVAGHWQEILNTDAAIYGGGNRGNLGGVQTDSIAAHGFAQSASIILPPLSCIYLKQGEVGAVQPSEGDI